MEKKKIAVTGGIGSGKSTVAEYIREEGFPVFSCDQINAELWQNKEYLDGIEKIFPELGEPDKKRIAERVFSDKDALGRLNAYAHPKIMDELKRRMEETDSSLVFAEVPLLFEGGYERDFDKTVIVLRKEDFRIAAAASRDGLPPESIRSRIENQFAYDRLLPADNRIFLENDGSLADLKRKDRLLLTSLGKKNL